MFCGNCGKKLPDDAMFCPFCGAKTDLYYEQESGSDAWDGAWDGGAYAEEPAPAAPVQQPAYTYSENTYVKPESGLDSFTNNIQAKLGATDNRPVTHEYQRLGGWLALIAYGCLAGAILTPIEGVISLMGMSSLSSMFAGYLDNMIAVITLFIVIVCGATSYLCFKMFSNILKKDTGFLRFYETIGIVYIGAMVLVTIVASSYMQATLGEYASYFMPSLTGNTIGSVISGALIFAGWTTYFVKSVRVRTYFGTDEYIRKSIFCKNVTPPVPAVPDRDF